MNESTQFLVRHGPPLVFLAVFLEQMGLPLPAIPLLLAAGSLSATGMFSPVTGILITVLACLMADSIWFYLGRSRGLRVLGWLCRISLEPDSCVRRTQNMFTRYGLRGVVLAKFVPGLSTVAPPLAGMAGIHFVRFLVADAFGSLLYAGLFLFLGFWFSTEIHEIASALASIGGSAVAAILGSGAVYIGFKYWQRQRMIRKVRMARITVMELRRKQESNEALFIVDLRSNAELNVDPSLIPGAVRLGVEEAEARHHEIPRDREIVIYCSCPNEISSAKVALLLQRKGVSRVRPLLGGFEAWRAMNYPTATDAQPLAGGG